VRERVSRSLERSEGDRSDLKHGEIAALLSVARNDDVTGFSAFVLVQDERVHLGLRTYIYGYIIGISKDIILFLTGIEEGGKSVGQISEAEKGGEGSATRCGSFWKGGEGRRTVIVIKEVRD